MGTVIIAFVSILNVFLGLVVLLQNPRSSINKLFSIFCFLVVVWISSTTLLPIYRLDFLGSLSFASGALIPFIFCLFVNNFPELLYSPRKLFYVVFGAPPVALSVASFFGLIIQENSYSGGAISVTYGPLFLVFIIYFLLYAFISFFILFKKLFSLKGVGKSQISILTYGILAFMVLVLATNIFLPMIGVNVFINIGPVFSLIMVVLVSYAIIRRGLFDIRLAIVRSATYSLLIATLAGIYAGSTFAISSIFDFGQSTPAQIISNAAISLILVFLFQPLRKFFDRVTSKIFYKDNYSSDEFFGRLNNTLAITTNLRELLERAASEISTTLKSSHAFFHVFASNDEQHISSGTTNHTDLSNDTATRIKKYITKNSKIIVALLLDEKEELKTILLADKIEIILPLIQDNKIIGFLCLGENMRSNYTDRDIVVLDAISGGLVIAIQNALAVQEIRDFNITLRKRIDEATEELRVKNAMLQELDKAKDEFVSMASHQLRTPLTSVKGYLSMVVEGDAGKVTSQQKELLNQAYTSNERMVDLVNDFLNVSRIQTGKFMLDKNPIDLSKLVDEEVKGLVQNASKRQIKLDYSAPKDFPTIDIDEGKLRQVVMNFIDNAIHYSNADSSIKIGLSVEKDEAIFTVKDTGIGVPASEQAGLFTKFYRASNAKKQRPDGTGVGLYLAKRIVNDHGGEIIFKTVEGKGSTFGFSLPIKTEGLES